MVRWPDPTPAGPLGGVGAGAVTLPATGSMEPSLSRSEGYPPAAAVLGVVALAIGLTALITPKGPGRLGPVDALIVLSVAAAFLWALRTKVPVHVPYVV